MDILPQKGWENRSNVQGVAFWSMNGYVHSVSGGSLVDKNCRSVTLEGLVVGLGMMGLEKGMWDCLCLPLGGT